MQPCEIRNVHLKLQKLAAAVAEVIGNIISGKRNGFRHAVGPYAGGFINYRASLSDEDWADSVAVDDETWIAGMEQMRLQVRKYMESKVPIEF